MAHFNIHFFRLTHQVITPAQVIRYFKENYDNLKTVEDNESFSFVYENKKLNYEGFFTFTKKSVVPKIHELDPKYLSVNVHAKISLLVPNFSAESFFIEVRKFVNHFNLYVYNELFPQILPYRMEYLTNGFDSLKTTYFKKNPLMDRQYTILEKDKLDAILRYENDKEMLMKHYEPYDTIVPHYQFFKNENNPFLIFVKWRELTSTVFPPHLDYVLYETEKQTKIISYDLLIKHLEKELDNVPGFIPGTKVILSKNVKKARRRIRKIKEASISANLVEVGLNELIDI